jgi:formate hydrogenlyase subunit 3/multisubunit Na+/H+ antiporter MnhD subunit
LVWFRIRTALVNVVMNLVASQAVLSSIELVSYVTSTSNIKILECFQSKASRMILDAPWYVLNTIIRRDLQTPRVKEEICRYSSQ